MSESDSSTHEHLIGATVATTSTPWQRFLIPLAIMALLTAVVGLHIEYGAGGANRYFFLDHGAGFTYLYRIFETYGLPMPIASHLNHFIFPDVFPTLLLMHFAQNPFVGMHLQAMLSVLVTAAGLWLLTRELWGKRLAYLALPIAALPSLFIAYNIHEEFFVTAIMPWFRGGLLALIPLLLWLSMRVLFEDRKRVFTAILFVLLLFIFASYEIIMTWYVAPAVLAMVGCLLAGKKMAGWKWFLAAIVLAYLLAEVLRAPLALLFYELPPDKGNTDFSFNWLRIQRSTILFMTWLVSAVLRMPLLFLLWAVFLGLLLKSSLQAATRQGLRAPVESFDKVRNNMFLFAALFIMLSILIQPAAAVVTGKYSIWGRTDHPANNRYFLPAVYWAFFWGWLLFAGWGWQWLQSRKKYQWLSRWAIEGFCGVVLLASAALFINLPAVGGLARYSSPFLECVDENAAKHNLTEGYAPADFAVYLKEFSKQLKPFPILNNRASIEASGQAFSLGQFPFGLHPERRFYGVEIEYPTNPQYIVVNWTDEAKYLTAPEMARCPARLSAPNSCYDHGKWEFTGQYFLDGKTVTDFWGEPDDAFRCSGVDFYIYKSGRLHP